MDECYTDDIEIRRQPSKRHTNQLLFGRSSKKSPSPPQRSTSLNVRENKVKRLPIARNISSPTTMQYANNHRYVRLLCPTTTKKRIMIYVAFRQQKIVEVVIIIHEA